MKVCPITEKSISNFNSEFIISYEVNINDERTCFSFCKSCFKNIDFDKYRIIILGLILNNKIKPNDTVFHWDHLDAEGMNLKSIIDEAYYPKTPMEKLDNFRRV